MMTFCTYKCLCDFPEGPWKIIKHLFSHLIRKTSARYIQVYLILMSQMGRVVKSEELHSFPQVKFEWVGTSLVAQLPMQGAWVRSLVRELDSTCMPQLRVCMSQLRVCMPQLRSRQATTKTWCTQINIKKISEWVKYQ